MSYFKLIGILIFISIKLSTCRQHSIHKRVEEIKNISKQMYGDVVKGYWQFRSQNMDDLLYPNGDKQKLSLLSSFWREYFDCSLRSLDQLTSHRQVPSAIVMVYAGAVARLPCSVCIAPNERNNLKWLYAQTRTNITFKPMKDNERMVQVETNLTIYNVRPEDAGVYRCEAGDSRSMAVLEVVDDDDYDVVKPSTSRGPYATSAHTLDNGLTVFNSWTPWSECSTCRKVGRRHRHGMCYVKLDQRQKTKHAYNDIILDKTETGLFGAFPSGIPCRSVYLPAKVRALDVIRERRNKIMIGMCKVTCKDLIYYTRSKEGAIVEEGNNTAGVYSLAQLLPKQPPMPVRDTIFADFEQWIDIRCPGTTLRDVPITWRAGTKLLVPRDLDLGSDGRTYINSRDHLVITQAYYRDANLYSCWQHDKLAGTVRLVVRSRECARAATLLALLAAALALLALVQRASRPTLKHYL